MTAPDMLRGSTTGMQMLRILARYPDREAFRWDDGALSYREASDLIGRLQRVYSAGGVRAGQIVAFLAGNDAFCWCASIAAQASGLAITWLHPAASFLDQCHQIEDSDASVFFLDVIHQPARAAEIAARFAGAPIFTNAAAAFGRNALEVAEAGGPAQPRDRAGPGDLAIINYTGGTTGRAKGVARSHASVVAYAEAILANFEIPETPRYLLVAPMTHVGGTKIAPVLARGGTVRLVNGFSAGKVLDIIARERVNFALLVPTMIYSLLDDPALQAADTSSLELILYGAAAMSPLRLLEAIERFGPVFSQLYGQTEVYPVAILRKADHDPRTPELFASCGMPALGAAVALLDDRGLPVEQGQPGEICVRSPCLMDRYWKMPDLTSETLADDWLHTGDIAVADVRGYLFIVDRKKDMIVTGGFNVFSREVEDALTSHPAVANAAAYGVPDERWGEAVVATIVLRPGHDAGAQEILSHVRERKGPIQTPKQLLFASALPMTAIGKVDKPALRKAHSSAVKDAS